MMDLTIYFEKIVRNFTRYHKYTLGSELREKSREIVGLIIKADPSISRAATPSKSRVGGFTKYRGHCPGLPIDADKKTSPSGRRISLLS